MITTVQSSLSDSRKTDAFAVSPPPAADTRLGIASSVNETERNRFLSSSTITEATRTAGEERENTAHERRGRGQGSDRQQGAGRGVLWEGEYDEEASARSFQEALAEWRVGRKTETKDRGQKTVNTAGLCIIYCRFS